MRQRSKSRWVGLRRNAIERAEDLALCIGKNLPTNLGEIALRQGVKGIQFRPLLADGGIAVKKDGFLIYVKADADEGEHLTAQFAEDGVGTGMPRHLIHRARFTIAHEIAHTFFYDVSATPPKPKIELKSATSVKSLERVCNAVAGALLIPEGLLERKFLISDLSRPHELSRLANEALISKHALIRRLQNLQRFPHPMAIVACVGRNAGGLVIESVSRHYSLRQVLISAKEGSPLSTLVDHPDFMPNGGEFPEVDFELIGPAGPIKIRFFCDETFRRNARGSFFVTCTRTD